MTFSLDLNQQPNSYFLNLQSIQNHKAYPSFVRLLAARLRDNPTMSLSFFLKDFLTAAEFEELNEIANTATEKLQATTPDPDEHDKDFEIILLLTWMLAKAESALDTVMVAEENTHHQLMDMSITLLSLIPCVSLYRKGLIELCWENVTLDPDYADKPLVRKLSGGRTHE